MSSSNSGYWAKAPIDEIAAKIHDKWQAYRSWLLSSGYGEKIRSQYGLYYNLNQHGLRRDGSLTRISVNMFRNAIDHVAILVSQNKLNYEFGAMNTDPDSLEQVRLGKDYMKYLLAEEGLDTHMANLVINGLICNEAWLDCSFDEQSGVTLVRDPDTGEAVGEGEQSYQILTPFDCGREVKNPSADKWKIVRKMTNKYDLAAVYEDHAELIESQSIKWEQELSDLAFYGGDDDENCHTYCLWHEKTASMPNGRIVLVCGDAVLFDRDLFDEKKQKGYLEVPIHRFAPGDMIKSKTGSSFVGDMVGPQQALSKVATATLSNELNLNLTTVWSKEPINMGVFQNGFQNINGAQPPVPVNLGQSNPQSFNAMSLYSNWIDKLSGINDLVRGAAPQGVTAASGMALLLSQSIAFASPISRRLAETMSRIATTSVRNACFIKEEKLISMVGKANTGTVRKIHSGSFNKIQRVVASIANPLALTQQGNQQMAMEMMKTGQIQDIRKIFMVAEGAPHEILYEKELAKAILMESERDAVREGINPPALIDDDHDEHIDDIMSVLNTAWLRTNPKVVAAVTAHATQHKILKAQKMAQQAAEAMAVGVPAGGPGGPPPEGMADQAPPGEGMAPPPEGGGDPRLAGVPMPSLPPGVQNAPQAAVPYAQVS